MRGLKEGGGGDGEGGGGGGGTLALGRVGNGGTCMGWIDRGCLNECWIGIQRGHLFSIDLGAESRKASISYLKKRSEDHECNGRHCGFRS